MPASVLVGLASVVLVAVPGFLLVLRPGVVARPIERTRADTPARRLAARLTEARDDLHRTLGATAASVFVVAAGTAIVVGCSWVFGESIALLEDQVDRPILEWMASRQVDWWTDPMAAATVMGDRQQIYPVCLASCVVLAMLAPRRRWVPVALVLAIMFVQHNTQLVLTKMVDRGHPPTGLGSYPSGGVSRILADYGLILFLAWVSARERGWATGGRRGALAAVTLVATLITVVGYTRVYLGRHWFTDLLGGLVFGLPLLLTFMFAARPLLSADPDTPARKP